MSFLIHLQDSSSANFIEYEKEIMRSVAVMNRIWIDSYQPQNLCLTCLGVHYKNDGGLDQISHISEMIKKGFGKCDSIVAWFMAVYSYYDIESEPMLVKRSEEELHAQMKIFENGKTIILDPSVNLQKMNKLFCNKCGGRKNALFQK